MGWSLAMKTPTVSPLTRTVTLTALAALVVAAHPGALLAKHKSPNAGASQVTERLFQLLDTSYGGKLDDWYLLGEVYKNPSKPEEELQHVYRLDYEKGRAFGKLRIYVRSVSKVQPEQLKTYTPKMIYEFGVADLEKFVKTGPGPFGETGDLYLRSADDRPLATAPITEDAQKTYEKIVSDELLPALQKK